MGHIRVGRLPKIRGWKQVIALFDSADSSSPDIAAATASAAKELADIVLKNKEVIINGLLRPNR